MIRSAALVLLLGLGSSARAAEPAAQPAGGPPGAQTGAGTMVNMSLVEALTIIDRPELGGLFTYITETDAPHAFATLLVRDPKAFKRYAAKVQKDVDGGGTTAWDHEVCAMIVNINAGMLGPLAQKLDEKRLKTVNACVLSNVLSLQDVMSRRKK